MGNSAQKRFHRVHLGAMQVVDGDLIWMFADACAIHQCEDAFTACFRRAIQFQQVVSIKGYDRVYLRVVPVSSAIFNQQ